MTKEAVLKSVIIEGNVVKLPVTQLDRKVYLEVKKSMELIGGKWKGGKVYGFVFDNDPTELIKQIANGEKRNLKKEFQFFVTPEKLANRLVSLANVKKQHVILEPSAGQGDLIEAILRVEPKANIFSIELMEVNSTILNKKGFNHELGDFLAIPNQPIYDRIVANPPFSKNQDIDHIKHMYDLLKFGGRLVSVASKHWKLSNNKKETAFRKWLEEVNAEVLEVEPGEFKESGTSVGATIIIINKI